MQSEPLSIRIARALKMRNLSQHDRVRLQGLVKQFKLKPPKYVSPLMVRDGGPPMQGPLVKP
jgi:hypothetical protein